MLELMLKVRRSEKYRERVQQELKAAEGTSLVPVINLTIKRAEEEPARPAPAVNGTLASWPRQ